MKALIWEKVPRQTQIKSEKLGRSNTLLPYSFVCFNEGFQRITLFDATADNPVLWNRKMLFVEPKCFATDTDNGSLCCKANNDEKSDLRPAVAAMLFALNAVSDDNIFVSEDVIEINQRSLLFYEKTLREIPYDLCGELVLGKIREHGSCGWDDLPDNALDWLTGKLLRLNNKEVLP